MQNNQVILRRTDREQYQPLTESEKEAVYEHLRRGGSPTNTALVVGIPTERLMAEFNNNPEFALRAGQERAKCLAGLEYRLHEIAINGADEDAKVAINFLLKNNMPEVYSSASKQLEDKLKRIVNG